MIPVGIVFVVRIIAIRLLLECDGKVDDAKVDDFDIETNEEMEKKGEEKKKIQLMYFIWLLITVSFLPS